MENYKLNPDINPLQIIVDEGNVLPRAFRFVVDNNTSNDAPYHHLNHMLRVMGFCNEACKYHRIEGKSRINLLVAALFHDYNHSQGELSDGENVKAAIEGVKKWYASNEMNQTSVNLNKVIDIIKATEYPYVIKKEDLTLVQGIIRDADLMPALETDWMGNIIVGLATEMKVDSFTRMADGQRAFHEGIEMSSPWGKAVYKNEWNRVFDNLTNLRKLL